MAGSVLSNGLSDAGTVALAAAPGLPRLDTVYHFQNAVGEAGHSALEESPRFRLSNLDVGEVVDGDCMSPGQTEMGRRRFLRTQLLAIVTRYFRSYERLESAVLCVARCWADEADDAVHEVLVVSELFEPTLRGVNPGYGKATPDANLPTTVIKPKYGEGSSSVISLWDTGVQWDDNNGTIPLWAAFAPDDVRAPHLVGPLDLHPPQQVRIHPVSVP